MDQEEWFWLYAVRKPRDKAGDYAGRLTEADCADLYELIS
jgi:hypothetical protein